MVQFSNSENFPLTELPFLISDSFVIGNPHFLTPPDRIYLVKMAPCTSCALPVPFL